MGLFRSGLAALLLLPAAMNSAWAAEPEAPPSSTETCGALCRLQRYFNADHMVTQVPAAVVESSQAEPKHAAAPAKKVASVASRKTHVAARKPLAKAAAKTPAGGAAAVPGLLRLAAAPKLIQPRPSRFASIIPGSAPMMAARFMALGSDAQSR